MPDNTLWSRLRKSRLVQVLAVYLGASWVTLQVTLHLREAAGLPDWVPPLAVVLLLIGLVVVLATAWVQSLPGTVERARHDEVPGAWEVGFRELGQALREGRMPHLTWGRALVGGLFAFWLLFGFAGLWVVVQDRGRSFEPGPAFAGPAGPGIAVVPFTTSGPDLDYLREGMISLLATNLDGLGGFRAIAGRTVLARWQESAVGTGSLDLPTVLDVARRSDGSYAVVGDAVAVGTRLRLSATVYDLQDGGALGRASAEGPAADILALVDQLSVQIIATLLGGSGSARGPDPRSESILTGSLPALRAYLDGLALYRRTALPEAVTAFQEAVAHDSTFALAHLHLGKALAWSAAASTVVEEHLDAALRFADRLSPRDALLARVTHAQFHRDPDGVGMAREAVRRYPDDPYAWYFLGELYYHVGEAVLAGPADAAEAFRRAVALEPGLASAYIHLLDIALSRGDEPRARELLATFSELAPDALHLASFHIRADLLFGEPAIRARTLAALDTLPLEPLQLGLASLRDPFSLATAEDLARVLHRRTGAPFGLATILLRRGKLQELGQLLGPSPDPFFTFLATALGKPDAIANSRDLLTRNLREPVPLEDLFALGMAAALVGDWSRFDAVRGEARRRATSYQATGDSARARVQVQEAALMDAYALVRDREEEGAIRALEELQRQLTGTGIFQTGQGVRWALGELLARSPRPEEALPYLESMKHNWPVAIFRMGQVHERTGDLERARAAYADFLLAWDEADEDLPHLLEAREALARLDNLQDDP
jgi:TolB-like protein